SESDCCAEWNGSIERIRIPCPGKALDSVACSGEDGFRAAAVRDLGESSALSVQIKAEASCYQMLCRLPAAQSLSLKAPFLTVLIYVSAAALSGAYQVPS